MRQQKLSDMTAPNIRKPVRHDALNQQCRPQPWQGKRHEQEAQFVRLGLQLVEHQLGVPQRRIALGIQGRYPGVDRRAAGFQLANLGGIAGGSKPAIDIVQRPVHLRAAARRATFAHVHRAESVGQRCKEAARHRIAPPFPRR